jgi:hypothetical protein
MANEAVLVLKYEDPIDFIVANGTDITKGAILKLTNPRTASLADGAANLVAGIAARDKVANDGRTRLAVFRRGVFRVRASGAVTAGDALETGTTGSLNYVQRNAGNANGGIVLGFALQDIADGDYGEMELNIQCIRPHA